MQHILKQVSGATAGFKQCHGRAYFKDGVQAKCAVQTEKYGVLNLEMTEMWSPNAHCVEVSVVI